MKMKFYNYVALLLSASVSATIATETAPAAAAAAPAAAAPAAAADTTVVARVTLDGKVTEVTLGQLKTYLKMLPPQIQSAPFEKIYELLLVGQINSVVVGNAAAKAGYPEKMAEQMKTAAETVVRQAFLQDQIKSKISDADKKKFYDDVIKALPPIEEARLRQITFADEGQAKKALADLKKGQKFEDVFAAATKADASVKGGDAGGNYIRIDDLPKEIAEEVRKAGGATLVNKVIKTQIGFHVVRVEDKRVAPTPTFEDVKEEITGMMAPNYAKEVIDGLLKDAKVEKFGMDGKPLPEAAPAADAAPAAAPIADAAAPAAAK